MDGNHLTGITIMRMERGLDTGPMLLQRALGIGIDDTAATMHDELADLGGRLMVEVLRQYADGDPSTPIPQEEALATYAAKLTKADGHIDWDEDAAVIHARIRGVTPWPGAQTVFLLPGRDPLPALLQPGRVHHQPSHLAGRSIGRRCRCSGHNDGGRRPCVPFRCARTDGFLFLGNSEAAAGWGKGCHPTGVQLHEVRAERPAGLRRGPYNTIHTGS